MFIKYIKRIRRKIFLIICKIYKIGKGKKEGSFLVSRIGAEKMFFK